jgi:cobalt/nickel transport system permease protein
LIEVEIDRYADLRSPVHAWDPRFKLASGFVWMLVCASITTPGALAAAAGAAVGLVLLSRLPVRFVLRALRAPLILLALMLPLLVFTSGGQPLWSLGILRVYREGLLAAGHIAAKALTIAILFVALFGTTRLPVALKALEHLKVPPTLLAILLFTYRYIHLYLEDMQKLLTAASLRGYNLRRGIRHAGSTSRIMFTLLLRSYEQSERVAAAMNLRGFNGSFPSLNRFRHTAVDVFLSAVTLGMAGFLLWLELR